MFFLGRHPCAGMSIAKLEIKVILAMILLGYEYELVDGNGNYPKVVPDQNRNDIHQVSPPCGFREVAEFITLCYCLGAAYGGALLPEIQTRR